MLALGAACAPDPPRPDRTDADHATGDVIDWQARSASIHATGWTVEFCEGEGPFLCVSRDGRHAGAIELLRWSIGPDDVAGRILAGGGTEREALEALAADLVATVAADRRAGCGPEYAVVPDESRPTHVAGGEGLRSGFRGLAGGEVVERVLHYRAIRRDSLYVLTASAYEPGGCIAPEGDFRVADLAAFEPLLDRVASASRLAD